MPFNAQGQWVPEDDSVTTQLAKLTAGDSPYIAQARAAGLASANSRGLLNSSIAAGASTAAAIGAAAPIASQNSQQISQKNLTYQQGVIDKEKQSMASAADMDRQRLVTASSDRQAALAAALDANKTYTSGFAQLAENKDLPAATRDAYIRDLINTRNTGLDMIQQVYGIKLNWAA